MASPATHPVPDGVTVGQRPDDKSDDGLDVVRAQTYRNGTSGFGWYPLGVLVATPGGTTFDPGALTARVQALENTPPSEYDDSALAARVAELEAQPAGSGDVSSAELDAVTERVTALEPTFSGAYTIASGAAIVLASRAELGVDAAWRFESAIYGATPERRTVDVIAPGATGKIIASPSSATGSVVLYEEGPAGSLQVFNDGAEQITVYIHATRVFD